MPSKALLLIVTRLLFPLRDLELCKRKEFLRNRKSSFKAHLQFSNFRSTKRVIRNGSQLIVIKGSERIRKLVDDFINLSKNWANIWPALILLKESVGKLFILFPSRSLEWNIHPYLLISGNVKNQCPYTMLRIPIFTKCLRSGTSIKPELMILLENKSKMSSISIINPHWPTCAKSKFHIHLFSWGDIVNQER